MEIFYSMNCLIVKNDARYSRIMAEYLLEKGFNKVLIVSPTMYDVRNELLKGTYHYVLLDATLNELSGFEMARAIKKIAPQTDCLISIEPDEFKLDFLIHFDISGYLSASASLKELLQCFELLQEGYRFMCSDIRKKLSQIEDVTEKDFSENDNLTRQEKRILQLLMNGKSTYEIASELFLSIHTINNHKTRIRNKLNLTSNRQLVFYAMHHRDHINTC